MNHTCLRLAFPAEAGTHLPTPEGLKAELAWDGVQITPRTRISSKYTQFAVSASCCYTNYTLECTRIYDLQTKELNTSTVFREGLDSSPDPNFSTCQTLNDTVEKDFKTSFFLGFYTKKTKNLKVQILGF